MKFNKIFINPLTVGIFILGYFTNNLKSIIILYIIAFMHESCHLITALYFKVKIKRIEILPFGISLKLEDYNINNPTHEFLIAAAGPFSNIVLAVVSYFIKQYVLCDTNSIIFFIFANIIMAVVNLIPVLPLDGGRMVKAILTDKFGFIKAYHIMSKIGIFIVLVMITASIYLLWITQFNISLLLICIFILFNTINEKRNSKFVIMKEIVYSKEKLLTQGIFKSKNIIALYNIQARKMLKYFTYNNYCIITVIDSEMRVDGVLTETQIIQGLVELGSHVSIGSILNSENSKK